jgi:hypothetical protein
VFEVVKLTDRSSEDALKTVSKTRMRSLGDGEKDESKMFRGVEKVPKSWDEQYKISNR